MKTIQQHLCDCGITKTINKANLIIKLGMVKVNNKLITPITVGPSLLIHSTDVVEIRRKTNGDWVLTDWSKQ